MDVNADPKLKVKLTEFSLRASKEARDLRGLINGNIADLSQLNTVEKRNLVAAINEIVDSKTGGLDLDDVAVLIADYFVLHPQSFTYDQGTPSNDWIIVHPLDHYPAVSLTDSAGTNWRAQITYPAKNIVRIQSNVPTTGTAVLT